MASPVGPDAIESGTGRSWADRLVFFETVGVANPSHAVIVEKASEAGAAPWWRQMVTVSYEQHIVLRAAHCAAGSR